jgi:hypothetical protein
LDRFFYYLLLSVLVGFGYLLSDSIRMHNMPEISKQQIDALIQENAQLKQQIHSLESQLHGAEAENLALRKQNELMQSEQDESGTDYPSVSQPERTILQLPGLQFFVIMILTLAALYIAYRAIRRLFSIPPASKNNRSVQLTEDEIKQIVRARRKQ